LIHFDTTLLIDLLREQARQEEGPATLFLRSCLDEEISVSVHVLCELYTGAELSRRPEEERQSIRHLCSSIQTSSPDESFPTLYGRILAWQTRNGQKVATMDLLIATAALAERAALVTRNTKDFSRVPGLAVLTY
jgi:tRNA(fMet)-specific endonuclease VapC